MRLLTNAHSADASAWLAEVLVDHDVEDEPSVQEWASRLYREPEALGVMVAPGPASAANHCARIRQGDVRNVIMVLMPETEAPEMRPSLRGRVLLAGADDAQGWPIDDRELLARLAALSRRGAWRDHLTIPLPGDCAYHFNGGKIASPRGDVDLTGSEERVLQALALQHGSTLSKSQILDSLYGHDDEAPGAKIIDVFVCKLRAKVVRATGGFDVVRTVWGRGYQFCREGYVPGDRIIRKRGPRVRASA